MTHKAYLTSVQKSETRKERPFSLPEKHRLAVFCNDNFNMFMAETAAHTDVRGF